MISKRDIYLKAAELIKSCKEEHACIAISRACMLLNVRRVANEVHNEFTTIFKPTDKERVEYKHPSDYVWLEEYDDPHPCDHAESSSRKLRHAALLLAAEFFEGDVAYDS